MVALSDFPSYLRKMKEKTRMWARTLVPWNRRHPSTLTIGATTKIGLETSNFLVFPKFFAFLVTLGYFVLFYSKTKEKSRMWARTPVPRNRRHPSTFTTGASLESIKNRKKGQKP